MVARLGYHGSQPTTDIVVRKQGNANDETPASRLDWFRYEHNPPYLSDPLAPVGRWATELAEAVRLGGTQVVTGYPVAGWSIDLAVGEGAAAFGVETSVHPDGPLAHAERHLTLRRAGWRLVSMLESSWLLQTEEAAAHVAALAAQRARVAGGT